MSLVVLAVLGALLLGLAAGGSVSALGRLPLHAPGLVLAALAAQLTGAVIGGPVHPLGLVVSAGLVAAFLVGNRRLRGTGLVALGLLANAAVVVANGAMPVSLTAAQRAGAGVQELLAGQDQRHVLSDQGTRLPWLGDVVPMPLPLRPEVVSPGDLLVAAGLALLVLVAVQDERTGPPRRRLPTVADRVGAAGGCATLEGARRSPDARQSARYSPPARTPRPVEQRSTTMAKRGRKRRARKKSAANHGKRPNA